MPTPILTKEFLTTALWPALSKLLPWLILIFAIKLLIEKIPHGKNKRPDTNSKSKISKISKEENRRKGREFEKHVGKLLEKEGWYLDYNGINKGMEDGGIDLIAKKDGTTALIQCKYRDDPKNVHHENEINQLCGALNTYKHDHPCEQSKAIFITTGRYSPEAKRTAKIHGIELGDGHTINLHFKPTA